ncbi:hypothetical protein TrRE_jg12103 [Triparma retinervis]|uniref:Uncharacterized protein n=1 Tax=Triparma retinervis TaxID=2557542 RepID=A0A9W6Z917_9STRA|nr:hypothetical protein TrRE_jg12103 [Triparma retinervis]
MDKCGIDGLDQLPEMRHLDPKDLAGSIPVRYPPALGGGRVKPAIKSYLKWLIGLIDFWVNRYQGVEDPTAPAANPDSQARTQQTLWWWKLNLQQFGTDVSITTTGGSTRPRRESKQRRFPGRCTCDDPDNCNCGALEHTEAPQRGSSNYVMTQIRKEKKRKLELEEKTEAARADRELKATIKRLKSIAKKPSLYPLDIDNLPPPPQRGRVPFLKEYNYNHLLYMAENR